MSLRKRIEILLGFLVAIPLLLLLWESYRAGRTSLVREMKEESSQIARLEAAEVNLIFDPPRLVTEGLLLALESQPELRPDVVRRVMWEALQRNPEIYGVALALAPSATPLGRFAPYVHRRGGESTATDLRYEYTERDSPRRERGSRWRSSVARSAGIRGPSGRRRLPARHAPRSTPTRSRSSLRTASCSPPAPCGTGASRTAGRCSSRAATWRQGSPRARTPPTPRARSSWSGCLSRRPRLSALAGVNLADRNRRLQPFAALGLGADLDL